MFGELATEVVAEGLALSNDIKLKWLLEKDRILGKRTLGDFCEPFGFDQSVNKSQWKRKSLTRPTLIKTAKEKEKKEIKPFRPKVKVKREKDFKKVKDF